MKPRCEICALEISGTVYSDADYEALCFDCYDPEPPDEGIVQNYFERPGCYGEDK